MSVLFIPLLFRYFIVNVLLIVQHLYLSCINSYCCVATDVVIVTLVIWLMLFCFSYITILVVRLFCPNRYLVINTGPFLFLLYLSHFCYYTVLTFMFFLPFAVEPFLLICYLFCTLLPCVLLIISKLYLIFLCYVCKNVDNSLNSWENLFSKLVYYCMLCTLLLFILV